MVPYMTLCGSPFPRSDSGHFASRPTAKFSRYLAEFSSENAGLPSIPELAHRGDDSVLCDALGFAVRWTLCQLGPCWSEDNGVPHDVLLFAVSGENQRMKHTAREAEVGHKHVVRMGRDAV